MVRASTVLKTSKTILKSPTFIHILVNTLIWTIAVVGLSSTLLGFILAMVLNQPFKGASSSGPWWCSLGHVPYNPGPGVEVHAERRLRRAERALLVKLGLPTAT